MICENILLNIYYADYFLYKQLVIIMKLFASYLHIIFFSATLLPTLSIFAFKNDYADIYWGLETENFLIVFYIAFIILSLIFLKAFHVYLINNRKKIYHNLGRFLRHLFIYSLTGVWLLILLFLLYKVFSGNTIDLIGKNYFGFIVVCSILLALSFAKFFDDFTIEK